MSNIRYILLLVAILVIQISAFNADKVVKIKQGFLRGYERTNRHGGKFYAFRSIPYAEPPLGKLRYLPPVPHSGWKGVYNASQEIPLCYQGTGGQEDCLYLSVYTKNTQTNRPKPVMVFIHGGGFVFMGPQEDFYNPENLMTEDIVVVTAAYRLGFLGFLNLGAEGSKPLTANAGMKDQVEVLRWVQRNIKYFGGDKKSVTIFGESAGGASVHFHLFSPLSKGLFHRAILESGTALQQWALGKPGYGEAIAERLNIPTTNLRETLKQLQTAALTDLFAIQSEIGLFADISTTPYTSPIVEGKVQGAFLRENPEDLLISGKYNHVPMMMGYNTKEGIFFDIFMRTTGLVTYLYDTKRIIPSKLNIQDEAEIAVVVDKIQQFYFNGHKPEIETDSIQMIDLITDILFAHGIVRSARAHYKQNDKVFFYEFGGSTQLNFYKLSDPTTSSYEGASHMDELGYLFKNAASPPVVPNSIEDRMVDKMVDWWTNFAYYGNPTPRGAERWNSINNGQINYWRIRNDDFSNTVNPLPQRIAFWDSIYRDHQH